MWLKFKEEHAEDLENAMSILNDKRLRKWLIKHGKAHLLDFQDNQIRKLKECFGSLDGDGSGAIGIEELEDPLIGLGFAENRKQVQEMIDAVDEDKSGQIEFGEFLGILKNSSDERTAKINKFFKDMASGHLGDADLPFNLLVQKMRREYMMNAIMSSIPEKREFGERILKNAKKQKKWEKWSQSVAPAGSAR